MSAPAARALVLARAMVRRQLIELRRYAFDTAGGLLTLYVLFLFVFFGARALLPGGPSEAGTLSAIVVGFLVWQVAVFGYSSTADTLSQEALAGTLEQLAMSPLGLPAVMLVRFVAGLAISLAMQLSMLVVMMASTGRWLHLDLGSIVPLLVLVAVGVQGVGMLVGGLALVFKRVQSLLQIVQFGFVFLVAVPVDRLPLAKFLPLAWVNELLQRSMVDGRALGDMPAADVVFAVVHAFVWLAAGAGAFGVLDRVARDRGLLGHY